MAAILLTSDLMFSSRVAWAGQRVGIAVQTAMGEDALLEKAAAGAEVVILDLTTAGLDVGRVVPRLRALAQPPARVVAFGPHVQEAMLAAAQAAGCDAVLARGEFNARMEEILRGA